MAVTLEELRVIVEGEIAPFQKKMKQLESQMKQTQNKIENSTKGLRAGVTKQANGIASALAGLGKIAALAYLGQKMVQLGMYSTQMALEVSASVNQIKRQMGESSQAFLKWIDNNANAMNMSVGEATKYGAVYSNLFSNFIKDSNKLSAYTGKMLQTSAVIAQGSGRTMTDVMERIRSGLLGNTEAIEDLGINVNVAMIESTNAFKRFANGQSWQQLDYNTQQQIRLMAILEQATAKYGNTLQQSVNGRISMFKSLLSDAALNIGNAMLPIINAMMPVLNSFAMVLKNVTAKLAEFIGLMFNKKAKVKNGSALGNVAQGAQKANDAVGDLGDAMGGVDDASGGTAGNLDDTAKSAKKAAKELMGLAGFDEITTLNLNKDDGSDGAGSGGGGKGGKGGKGGGSGSGADILPEIALEDMDTQFKSIFDGWLPKLKELGDLFGKGFKASFRAEGVERLLNALDRIKKTLSDIFTDSRVTGAFDTMLDKWAYALGQFAGSLATVALGIGVFIAESIANGLERQKERIISALTSLFTNLGDIGQSAGNIAQVLSSAFYDVITSTGAVRIGSAIVSTFLSLSSTVIDIGSQIGADLMRGLEQIISENAPRFSQVLAGALENIAPIFETIEQAVDDFGDAFGRVYDEHISPFISSLSEGLSYITSVFIEAFDSHVNPALERFSTGFSEVYDTHIKPAMDSTEEAVGKVFDAFKALWEEVLVPFGAFLSETLGINLGTITDILGGALIEAIKLLSDTWKGLMEGLEGFATWCENNTGTVQGLATTVGVLALAWKGIEFASVLEQAGGIPAVFENVKTAFNGVKTAIEGATIAKAKDIAESITLNLMYAKDFVVNTASLIAQKGQEAIAWGISTAAKAADIAVTTAMTAATWLLNAALAVLTSPITLVIAAITALIAIGYLLVTNWDTISAACSEIWGAVVEFIGQVCQNIGKFFSDLWKGVQDVFSGVGQWFSQRFTEAWNAIVQVFQGLGQWFGDRWRDIENIFSKVGSWFGQKFSEAWNGITNAFSNVAGFFRGIYDNIVSWFTDIGRAVGDAVSGAFKSGMNGAIATVENVVNGFISLINGAIGLINKIPGVNIGSIGYVNLPRLARGGIVDSPTVAMIGEAGKEVVMPLENTGFLQTMGRVVGGAVVNALGGGLQQSSGLPSGDIVFVIGSREFGRFTIDEINRAQAEAGQLLLNI
ncbi:TPA: hypothetical protein U1266_000939 [Streptococcus suis]|nr:hypothetical protein [Streptococcus suis]HEM5152478.1 hypothetical protein [Streptococcus suis]HEM5169164.1 hypothetical protein [Streptococcus suis]